MEWRSFHKNDELIGCLRAQHVRPHHIVWVQHLDTTALVETPERVHFRYRLAGPGPRAVAWFIDVVIRVVLVGVVIAFVSLLSIIPTLAGAGMGLLLLWLFFLDWGYGAAFEIGLQGRTPGKMAMGLRVVRADGSPGRVPDFVLRNMMRGVDFLPGIFGIGVAVMWWDPRMRRLGDLVGGTVVVREDRSQVLGTVAIDPPVSEEERRNMPGRVVLGRDETAIIETFLRRRRRLSDERAEELALLLGPALSERTGVQAPSWERVLTLAYARATGRDREAD
ncbi:MAG: RDD family protein [Rhodobacterales bacterium]|nr:RDD family protein [Rhodobacterales bacterium]